MDAPLNILIGVMATALPFGCLFSLLCRGWPRVRVAILGATAAAAVWAIGYGIYGWQHRMDWEHVRNYPLWIHIGLMTLSAVIYALVAFVPSVTGAAFLCWLSKRHK